MSMTEAVFATNHVSEQPCLRLSCNSPRGERGLLHALSDTAHISSCAAQASGCAHLPYGPSAVSFMIRTASRRFRLARLTSTGGDQSPIGVKPWLRFSSTPASKSRMRNARPCAQLSDGKANLLRAIFDAGGRKWLVHSSTLCELLHLGQGH